METIDFLRVILPEDCWYFVATPSRSGKGFTHHACRSIEEVAHRAAHLDSEGMNVYFACSGFRDDHVERPVHAKDGTVEVRKQYRVKENVKLVKAFWLDLDVEAGNQTKYPDQRTALIALNDFLAKTGLPLPMIVSSGYGVHVYWPLESALLPGQWRSIALQLKELCNGTGLLTDNSRTSDESSVLRPVGTTNRKIKGGTAGAAPVRLLYPLEGQPVVALDYRAFHGAVTAAMKTAGIEVVVTDKSSKMKVNPEDMIVPVGGFQKVSAIKVADKCQQIRLFRDTGGVSEPHWYHSLQIMPHTIEGEALAHEWSKVYATYTAAETDLKLGQVREMGPTLCAKFKDVNPDGCKDCPFAGKISTPLQLGMVVEEAPAPVIKEIVDGLIREVTLPAPPWPFKRGTGEQPGLYVEVEQGVPVRFYPYDLFPSAIINDEGKREGSVNVRHWLPQEGWRDFGVRLELIESPREFLGKMRNNFVNPENGRYMVTYMDAYLRELQDKMKIKQLHTKLGWMADGSFLIGTKLFTKNGTFPAGLSSTVSTEIVTSYHAKGTHEAWSAAIKKYDKPGLESHLFSILTGFAAPLFKLTGHSGIVASMLGVSNAGKTLAARAMVSIYGNFEPFKAGKEDTVNARIERLGMLSNMPVYIDETTDIDAEVVGKLMYQISSGKGKARLRSDASMKEPAVWSTVVLTSGNKSIVGRLMGVKENPEAELVRLFEYPVPKLDWFEMEMPTIYDELEANYGHAGEKYISFLVRMEHEDIKKQVKAMSEVFQQAVGFDGKERFWYALVSTVLYSLWLAKASDALVFDDLNATYQRLWKWCVTQVLKQRGDIVTVQKTSVEILSEYLNAHLAERIVVSTTNTGPGEIVAVVKTPAPSAKLRVEYNLTSKQIVIDMASIRNWLYKNQYDPAKVREELGRTGVLMHYKENRDVKMTLGKGTPFSGLSQTRVWKINATHPELEAIADVLQQDTPEEET